MKICLIGDSHSAAVKLAYEATGYSYPSLKIRFFAARGNGLYGLEVEDKILRAEETELKLIKSMQFTSGGISKIDPEDYDAFICMGLSRGFGRLLKSVLGSYSRNAKNTAIRDFWRDSLGISVLRKLRQITSKPIYLGHAPLAAATKRPGEKSTHLYESMVKISNELVFKDFEAQLIAQPLKTVVNGLHTKDIYAQGAKRLDIGIDDLSEDLMDRVHMNQEFGELWLSNISNILKVGP